MRSAVRKSRSQGYADGSRAQNPTLALPPLSPERAPAIVPSGARRVGPEMSAAPAGLSAGSMTRGGPDGVGGIATIDPSAITTAWFTTFVATTVGQYTPYAVSAVGGVVA